MLTARQIEMAQALARRRHFGLAAKDLGVSQPSLTRSLKQLEAELGVRLFDRQGVAPTLFGEIVLRRGARALAEFDDLAREIALAKGLELGELSIAAGLYPADISAEMALGLLIGKHPRLRVDFRAMNWERAAKQVLDGSVDLGLAELPGTPESDELDVQLVRTSHSRFFCRADHPLLRKQHVMAEDVFEMLRFAGESGIAPSNCLRRVRHPATGQKSCKVRRAFPALSSAAVALRGPGKSARVSMARRKPAGRMRNASESRTRRTQFAQNVTARLRTRGAGENDNWHRDRRLHARRRPVPNNPSAGRTAPQAP